MQGDDRIVISFYRFIQDTMTEFGKVCQTFQIYITNLRMRKRFNPQPLGHAASLGGSVTEFSSMLVDE